MTKCSGKYCKEKGEQPIGHFYIKKSGKVRQPCRSCIAKCAAEKRRQSNVLDWLTMEKLGEIVTTTVENIFDTPSRRSDIIKLAARKIMEDRHYMYDVNDPVFGLGGTGFDRRQGDRRRGL